LSFKYNRVVPGFAMPLRVEINGQETTLTPNETMQTITLPGAIKTFAVNRNFYVDAEAMP
jgi:hypothetical protein